MKRHTLTLALALVCGAGLLGAQVSIPPIKSQPVVDPTMLVEDRGQKLEIFPTVRASTELASNGRTVVHRLRSAPVNSILGPRSLGVLYNHTIEAQGFLTGEITFQPTADELPSDFRGDDYPGLKKIVEPNTYEVVARTPSELMALLATLKARTDLQWVELFVNYGVSSNNVIAVLDAAKKKATVSAGKK
jgi:hypothetical protein